MENSETDSEPEVTQDRDFEHLSLIPTTLTDVRSEADKCGMTFTEDNPPIWKQDCRTPRQQLLTAIYFTSKLNRSHDQAFLFLLGHTGTGKSSTINHLFGLCGNNKIKVRIDHSRSCTTDVQEYVLKADNPNFAIKDATLSVVDTPGFGDTRSVKQDACNFHAIKKFREMHPKLSGKKPNLIFLVIRATDTRFSGPNSQFGKTLRGLKHLDIIDMEHPNIICIMTHVCSFQPGQCYRKPKEWYNDLKEKSDAIKLAIVSEIELSVPIVFIENDLQNENIEKISGYTKLPVRNDESIQPQNLFVECEKLLQKNSDYLGEILFNSCFKNDDGDSTTTEFGLTIKTKIAEEENLDKDEENSLHILQSGGINQAEKIRLDSVSIKEKKNVHLPSKEGEVLLRQNDDTELQGIDESSQIQLSTHCSNITEKLPHLNHGYDAVHDRETYHSVFCMKLHEKGLGIPVPEGCAFAKLNATRQSVKHSEGRETNLRQRLKESDILLNITADNFQEHTKQNRTCKKDGLKKKQSTYEFSQTIYTAEIYIDNPKHLAYSDEFMRAVDNLSVKHDDESFRKFYQEWGQFLITKVTVGGKISGNIKHSRNKKYKYKHAQGFLSAHLEGLKKACERNKKYAGSNYEFTNIEFCGGDSQYHRPGTFHDPDLFEKWLSSVRQNPVVLSERGGLECMHRFVARYNKVKGDAAYEAFKDYLSIFPERSRTETVELHETNFDDLECFSLHCEAFVPPGSFPSERKALHLLNVGDQVLVRKNSRKAFSFSPVIGFGDYYKSKPTKLLKITLMNGKFISLTKQHIVMIGIDHEPATASTVKVGDILSTVKNGEKSSLVYSKVISIEEIDESGCCAPITMEGTIVVNGVIASCYASTPNVYISRRLFVNGHNLAHLALSPLRLKYKISSSQEKKRKKKIHPYIDWLSKKRHILQTCFYQ